VSQSVNKVSMKVEDKYQRKCCFIWKLQRLWKHQSQWIVGSTYEKKWQ